MTTAAIGSSFSGDESEYKRRIWAWTMYDWANSAFATTILAAVLPVYFSQVAGATLPSATIATAYWSIGLSLSLFLIAILSPILGTISDVMRGKKRFLAIFAGIGIISTALLVLVSTGDWILASIFGILGRIGFSGANTFYDALLPHVAREEDRDAVSARGYAMGYLGGGILLAINVVMIQLLPGTWGARLSFLSVAIWWAVFSIPLLLRVPEPPAATAILAKGETILKVSFKRLAETLKDIRRYRELFKYLVSFLIYNDGIGTIIGVAAIYGAELGFGSVELILALLLVQFVGIPYSLIFGGMPGGRSKHSAFYLAFVLFNLVALPLVGVSAARLLPAEIAGAPAAPFLSSATAAGEGSYPAGSAAIQTSGDWQLLVMPASEVGGQQDLPIFTNSDPGSRLDFRFNGQKVQVDYNLGPEGSEWQVYLDEQPVTEADSGEAMIIDGFNPTLRYGVSVVITAETPGEHTLSLVNGAAGGKMSVTGLTVLPGARQSNLGLIFGLILALEALGLALSFLVGPRLFSNLAARLDTRSSILLALVFYIFVAIWGFFLNSVVEFWFLAWMVAVVQGGSQALSRSLYSAMSPAAKSGEFFGLFGIMEKFSAIIGPLLFALAGFLFGSSRPAVLSLILIFILGGYLLTRVNIEEGRRVAQEEDARYFGEKLLI